MFFFADAKKSIIENDCYVNINCKICNIKR